MSRKFVPVEKVSLLYLCPECGNEVEQPLTELTEVGTAICAECDANMILADTVKVSDWFPLTKKESK